MSWDASRYVRKLRGVTRTEKVVLFVLAEYHNQKAQVAWPALPTLAADVNISERQLIRILQSLEVPREDHPQGILRRARKSDGRGAITEYSFPEMVGKGDISPRERVTFSTQKGDISDTAIRKEPYEPELEPKNRTLPNPPLQGGNTNPSFRLTRRHHTRISRWIEKNRQSHDGLSSRLRGASWIEVIQHACAELFIPFEAAKHDLLLMDPEVWQARFGMSKEPQRAIG
jgi:hypothetical protein